MTEAANHVYHGYGWYADRPVLRRVRDHAERVATRT